MKRRTNKGTALTKVTSGPSQEPEPDSGDPVAYADALLEPELTEAGLEDPVFGVNHHGMLALGNGGFLRTPTDSYEGDNDYA